MEPLRQNITKRHPVAEINVVPYIDVMLVLLIIFMVTAPMLVQTVPVNLPEVDSTPVDVTPDDSTVIITVSERGLLFVEREEQNPEAMLQADVIIYAQKIKQTVPNTKIMIRGDKSVPYGVVVELMGNLQNAGIVNVGLITEAPAPSTVR